jgi:hypothetical protein
MKKSAILFIALFILGTSFAAFVTQQGKTRASDLKVTMSVSGKKVSVAELSTMSVKEFQEASGQKLNMFEKLAFKVSQRKLNKMIDADGNVDQKTVDKFAMKELASGSDFNIGGLALGLLLSLIGVLLAYLIGGKGSSLVKWSWYGAAIGAAIIILASIL